jgi:N6-L-threonylcarbamoyladenine synthase
MEVVFPALGLLISGGHTELIAIENWGKYTIIGKTRDDAIGEAYDKAARILGLPYPGGPAISNHAEHVRNTYDVGNIKQLLATHSIKLPRPMIHSHDLDFSFSGLKTAVLYLIRDIRCLLKHLNLYVMNLKRLL